MFRSKALWFFSFFTPQLVASLVAEIKLWVSPFYPVSFANELTEENSIGLNFPHLYGKRFVPKVYRLWNAIQSRMVGYCVGRFEKLHGKPNFVRTSIRGRDAIIHVIIMANLPETQEIPIEFVFRQSFRNIFSNHMCEITVEEIEDKIDQWNKPYTEKRIFSLKEEDWSNGLNPTLFNRL